MRQTPPGRSVTVPPAGRWARSSSQVSDTGRGIPFHVQAHIFDRFVGRERGGPGLGLALVKALVELHGGWVALESEPGAGPTFTCHLPEGGAVRRPARNCSELTTIPRPPGESREGPADDVRQGGLPGTGAGLRAYQPWSLRDLSLPTLWEGASGSYLVLAFRHAHDQAVERVGHLDLAGQAASSARRSRRSRASTPPWPRPCRSCRARPRRHRRGRWRRRRRRRSRRRCRARCSSPRLP